MKCDRKFKKQSWFSQIILIFAIIITTFSIWLWGVRQILPVVPPGNIPHLYKGVALDSSTS